MTDAVEQLNPAADGSSDPLTVRHDDFTAHVPTTSPPHAVAFEHDDPPLPPTPDVLEPLELQAAPAMLLDTVRANASANRAGEGFV